MSPILADAGVPMLFLLFPWAFHLLVPIVALETWLAVGVARIAFRRRLLGVVAANAFSTLVGWPLTWMLLALIQLFVIPGGGGVYGLNSTFGAIASVTVQAAWLIPYEDDLYWMIPTAAMVLMLPAFVVTVYSERLVLKYCWPEIGVAERNAFVWKANLASYALLIAAGLFWLFYSASHSTKRPRSSAGRSSEMLRSETYMSHRISVPRLTSLRSAQVGSSRIAM